MKKTGLILTTFICVFSILSGQEKMEYFLPADVGYDTSIPTPESFFHQQMGEWHLTHGQILDYLHTIDKLSDRVSIEEYARSYENKPLIYVIFSSPENQTKLEELKDLHSEFIQPGSKVNQEDVPLVVTLGYSIHGNESSAANSSVLTAYYLAAAQGAKIDKLLNNTIIMVDPCLNPDGFTRHSTWANMNQSRMSVPDSDSQQFNEGWPGGRTNHYWFDMNRDYLLLVNPESRGRIREFHEWMPNVVTDHHEMGSSSSFFFQPGVPERNNPLTPEKNYTLTKKIGSYHAAYLDSIGSYYFSQENFDDFYYGKGSTYPDIHGSIGILFEQAGFRGRVRETPTGVKKFAFAIRNHFNVSLSSLEAALDMKDELIAYQKTFFEESSKLAEKDPVKGYIFGDRWDTNKNREFAAFLSQHQIDVYALTKDVENDGTVFGKDWAFAVPLKQNQYRLIKTFFEETIGFRDTTFYDVSTWTMPFAWDIPYIKAGGKDMQAVSEKVSENFEIIAGNIFGGKSNYAYLFRWNKEASPKLLSRILQKGVRVKVAGKSLQYIIDEKPEEFSNGTILIPVPEQRISSDGLYKIIKNLAAETGVDIYSIPGGWTDSGIDLGSNDFSVVGNPSAMMMVGNGVSSREAGEIWHLFDTKFDIPLCLADVHRLGSANLDRYNTLILPSGRYNEFSAADVEKIGNWVRKGNTLILSGSANRWAVQNKLIKTEFKKPSAADSSASKRYADRDDVAVKNLISGAIFNTQMDITHPLCYGYERTELPIFKTGTLVAENSGKPYVEPVHFTENPLLSGYASPGNIKRLKGAPVVSLSKSGRGVIISFYEDMNFRGYWSGTNKILLNAVFFSGLVK